MQVQTLGWEYPLEESLATHSGILAWTEEPGGLQSAESDMTEATEHACTHNFQDLTGCG